MQGKKIKDKKGIWIFSVFILILIINIFLAYILIDQNKNISILTKRITEYNLEEQYMSIKIEHYANVIKWLQHTEQTILSQELMLQDERGNTFPFSQIVDNTPILFFKYSELDCNVCIDSQLNFVKKFVEKYGENKLIMISSYQHPKSIINFKTYNKLENPIYNVNELGPSFAKLNIPYYFILDKSFSPKAFHFPNKSFPKDTERYFDEIEKLYFNAIYKQY